MWVVTPASPLGMRTPVHIFSHIRRIIAGLIRYIIFGSSVSSFCAIAWFSWIRRYLCARGVHFGLFETDPARSNAVWSLSQFLRVPFLRIHITGLVQVSLPLLFAFLRRSASRLAAAAAVTSKKLKPNRSKKIRSWLLHHVVMKVVRFLSHTELRCILPRLILLMYVCVFFCFSCLPFVCCFVLILRDCSLIFEWQRDMRLTATDNLHARATIAADTVRPAVGQSFSVTLTQTTPTTTTTSTATPAAAAQRLKWMQVVWLYTQRLCSTTSLVSLRAALLQEAFRL